MFGIILLKDGDSVVYLITFMEGVITFISPCLLPMLPLYFTYLGGSDKKNLMKNAIGFVLGFTLMFTVLGAFSGQLGSLLIKYQTLINIIGGLIITLFGLSYMGLLKLPNFSTKQISFDVSNLSFVRSIVFGLIFSISWTPCVGTFLASALMLAASQSSSIQGILLLLAYSAGLAVPMLLSALLLDQLREAFTWIKQHYGIINKVCGALLVLLGILMMSGLLSQFLYSL